MNECSERYWKIALSGIWRFFDEGMTKWSKAQFDGLFSSKQEAGSEYVLVQLRILEDQKYIVFVGSDIALLLRGL